MAFKYTGRARTFNFHGKLYAHPDLYRKHPHFYDASYDSPITGMTREFAEKMAANSNLHSFEDTSSGGDVLEQATAPIANVPDGDLSTVKLDSDKGKDKR